MMLLRCISCENKKMKSPVIYLVFFLIPLLPAIMGTFNYLGNIDVLTHGWYDLWTQHTLFYADFFFAPLMAVYASYLWRIEHLNHNWNLLLTSPVDFLSIFLGKFVIMARTMLLTQFWVGVLFFISGKFAGLPGAMPPVLLFWLFRGCLGGLSIIALQLFLSMMIKSFSVPIIISLFGSIASLWMVNGGKGYFWPYALMMLGMNSNSSNDKMGGFMALYLLSILLFCVIFAALSVTCVRRRRQ